MNSFDMDATEKQKILYLIQKRITKEDFLASISPVPVFAYMRDGLQESLQREDAESVYYLLMLGSKFDFSEDTVGILCDLINEKWHTSQEEIARILGMQFAGTLSVERVATAMQNQYPHMGSEDFRFPFVIKCAYALADSGKAEGIEKLKELACSEDTVVRVSAQWQLDRLAGKNPEPLIW
ncbi:MAG: hypothetical protein HUU01_07375 [Saprospiraceae bacterium]|nr:hypothetical protein [Saprospiraceae bacterium]